MVIHAATEEAKQKLLKLQAALTPANLDGVVQQAAERVYGDLVRLTPKKWFGQVRAGWGILKPQEGVRIVRNSNIIMLFLEAGTRAHGPREIYGPLLPGQKRRKAALFIPLTRRAVNATAGAFEIGSALIHQNFGNAATADVRPVIYKQTVRVRGGKESFGRMRLVYGVDYVLAKWVRGIRPMNIVANYRATALQILADIFKAFAHNALK